MAKVPRWQKGARLDREIKETADNGIFRAARPARVLFIDTPAQDVAHMAARVYFRGCSRDRRCAATCLVSLERAAFRVRAPAAAR